MTALTAMTTTVHPELLALLLADARLPVAGHTQSAGLEPALAAGPVDVPAYVALRLRTVTRTEAATAVVARAQVLAGAEDLSPVQAAWAARTPSAAMRQTSRGLGRALLRLAPRLAGAAWGQDARGALPPQAVRPVVLGALAAYGGVDAAATARVVAYDDVQTVVAAALKLTPLDPADATAWVVGAFAAVDEVVAAVAHLTEPHELPARNAPVIEENAERHAHTTRRLFSA